MAGMDGLLEMVYFVLNKTYFKVTVYNHRRKIKSFLQLAADSADGKSFFLINKGLLSAWFKPSAPFIEGLKFIVAVDINNAIPLKMEVVSSYTGDLIVREEEHVVLKEDKDKPRPQNAGEVYEPVEIAFPPTVLLQQVEARMVEKVMSEPPNKWAELKWVFIAGIVVLGIIMWQLMSSGGLKF